MRSLLTVLFALLTTAGPDGLGAIAAAFRRAREARRRRARRRVRRDCAGATADRRAEAQAPGRVAHVLASSGRLRTSDAHRVETARGLHRGPIEWPHPKRLPTGPLVNFGYDGEILLLTTINVPADLPVGNRVTLAGKAEWLECKDVCIPGDSDIALTLPVNRTAGPSAQAALFEATRRAHPADARRRDGPGHDRWQPDQAEPRAAGWQDGHSARVLPACRKAGSRRPPRRC